MYRVSCIFHENNVLHLFAKPMLHYDISFFSISPLNNNCNNNSIGYFLHDKSSNYSCLPTRAYGTHKCMFPISVHRVLRKIEFSVHGNKPSPVRDSL